MCRIRLMGEAEAAIKHRMHKPEALRCEQKTEAVPVVKLHDVLHLGR